MRDEGAYANGRLHVELLPAQLYGAACEKQFSLRRLEAVLTEAEQQEHLQKEMLKVWCCVPPGAVSCWGDCCVQLHAPHYCRWWDPTSRAAGIGGSVLVGCI